MPPQGERQRISLNQQSLNLPPHFQSAFSLTAKKQLIIILNNRIILNYTYDFSKTIENMLF